MSSKPQQRTDFTLWLCVFISGLSALIYQVAWQRLLVRLVGAALPALTIVVCIFMTGLAIGSLIASDRCKTITSPRKIYSYLELALGALGFLIPWATERTFALLLATISGATEVVLHQNVVEALLTPAGGWFVNALLIVAVSILLLAPTILMGATLPVAVLAAVQRFSSSPHNGARVTSLYFINVAGAAIGSLTAAFFLMPVFGVNNTVRVAAAINLAASLLLQFSHRIIQLSGEPVSSPFLDEVEPQEGTQGADQSRTPIRLLAAVVAVCSAVALSMEVAWTRLFSLVLGSSTYALGAVLAFCLIGIAAGALLARKLLEGGQNRLLKLSALVALSLLCTAGQLFYMAELPWYLNSLEHSLAGNPSPFATYILVRVLLIGAVALPQSTLLGAVLPLALGQAAEKRSTAAQVTGTLLCASTTGSIAGTIITGCLLIPQAIPGSTWLGPSGIQSTVIIDALVQMGVVAALLWHCCQGKSPSDSRPTSLIYACASLAVLATGLVCLHPRWQPSVMSSGLSFISPSSLPALTRQPFGVLFEENKSNGSHTLSYKEGQTSTVTVGIVPANNVIYLKNDGKVEAALPIDPRLATRASDQPTQVLLGLVPALICADKPKSTFLAGYGSGTTAGALLTDPQIDSLTIGEIEPAIYEADHYFNVTNNRPLREEWKKSGRVRALSSDARNLIDMSPGRYDLIVSQPAEPWIGGSTDLYSLEFWKSAKSKLTEHGIFSQWIQLYSIDPEYLAVLLRTFHDVFPNIILFHPPRAGELIVVGFHNSDDKIEYATVEKRLKDPALQELLKRIGISSPGQLLKMAVGDNVSVTRFCVKQQMKYGSAAMNSDNNLLVEYALPPKLFIEGDVISKNLQELGLQEN